MAHLIELSGIKKSYQLGMTEVVALRGVDLTIDAGEFTVVTGPSGSGKTTLLNIIGCLDRASGGRYVLDGLDVSNRDFDDLADVRNQKIGFIFQSFNLIPVLDVAENIEFPCAVRSGGESPAALRARVVALAKAVGLEQYLHHKPDELSGGQRQRVAIARALITTPRLVLADEPTANLDSVTGNQILALMKDLNQKEGVTFIFSTHDQKVMELASRIVRVQDGRIVDDGKNGKPTAATPPTTSAAAASAH